MFFLRVAAAVAVIAIGLGVMTDTGNGRTSAKVNWLTTVLR